MLRSGTLHEKPEESHQRVLGWVEKRDKRWGSLPSSWIMMDKWRMDWSP
jgi:hypothetical protein